MVDTSKTQQYIKGMTGINHFYAMLYQALKEMFPGIELSKNGAYGWRGYQISKYMELAKNKYYCQLNLDSPQLDKVLDPDYLPQDVSKFLVFEEGYQDAAPPPGDIFEERLKIRSGSYYYPFKVSLDLYRCRFFHLDKSEQYKMIKYFIAGAVNQALVWQKSKARIALTNPKYLEGTFALPRHAEKQDYDQVPLEFLIAWHQQDYFFNLLNRVLVARTPWVIGRDVEWIKPNASPSNFDFRGLRQKLKSEKESDSADFLWAIYFDHPDSLECRTMEEKQLIRSYSLTAHSFFDLEKAEQEKQLADFVQESLLA